MNKHPSKEQPIEIERLTKLIPPAQGAPAEPRSPKPKTPAGAVAKAN
jgi:hypothetical protein